MSKQRYDIYDDEVAGIRINHFPIKAVPLMCVVEVIRQQSRDIAELREALGALLGYAESNLCTHDDTYRGGAIWEICRDCGAAWADDRGGKPPFSWPKEFVQARVALAKEGV